MARTNVLVTLCIATLLLLGGGPALATATQPAVGTIVRDLHGARVGTVRSFEHDATGTATDVVIALGRIRGGGERYVVVPWQHLEPARAELIFRGTREHLVDAPRHSGSPPR
jgi:hypothetical protein